MSTTTNLTSAQRRALMVRSRFAFAAAEVVALRHDEQGIPLGVVSPEGIPLALAFTDPAAAVARIPAGVAATPLSLPMSRLVAGLPADWGLVLDIDQPYPQVVQPDEKQTVIAAGGPFPDGAEVTLRPAPSASQGFSDALAERAPLTPGVVWVWLFRHGVDIVPEDLMVVVATADRDAAFAFSEIVFEVARAHDVPVPVLTAWIDELPVEHATWVRQQPPLAHVERH
ncbi:hypothetical protein EDF31_104225 [Curtobacterium sp. PhB142]|uniref:hypothetical protein n=1 Tax=unclassified Curtobacterium TaxID=257496 RepID=UPI00104E0E00|nr:MULTISPECIES: hypothetical protein [unclassified Curtobacterium]TCL86330.1 hypothetical protein EDF31_104225 [Curtobacterium sp. PhB142]TCM02520.1 hypothetical protein EDF26_104225 [Curtobacterium sp. PhB134]